MTLTVFNQPPDLGNCFIKEGNMANNANGMAKAMAKPPIPTAGASVPPQEAASTNRDYGSGTRERNQNQCKRHEKDSDDTGCGVGLPIEFITP